LGGEIADPNNGGVNTLFAKFLLMEERMQKTGDERIQFVGKRDRKPTYVFLDNTGDIRYCAWFSRDRKLIGNALKEGFPLIRRKLVAEERKGVLGDEEGFVEALNDMPLWARLWEGNYDIEECKEVSTRYVSRVEHLDDLYKRRLQRQEALVSR